MGTIRLEVEGPVARLKIDRVAKRNAMSQAMWELMPSRVAEAVASPAVRVIVLQSAAPGVFCAGADIGELSQAASDPAWLHEHRLAIRETQLALSGAAKPIIAAVDGDCVGGGCGLALACDIRIATPRSRFGITPAKLGLVYPLHDVRLLVDLVGPGQAKRILYSAGLLDAGEAQRIGLVEIVTDTIEHSVMELAHAIAQNSPRSVAATKRQVARVKVGMHDDDDASAAEFEACFQQDDFREGVAAFLERRDRRFRD